MELEDSLPHPQQPATWPYSEPDQPSPCTPSHFRKIYFNIILPSAPGPSKWAFPSGFPTKPCMCSAPQREFYFNSFHFILFYIFHICCWYCNERLGTSLIRTNRKAGSPTIRMATANHLKLQKTFAR